MEAQTQQTSERKGETHAESHRDLDPYLRRGPQRLRQRPIEGQQLHPAPKRLQRQRGRRPHPSRDVRRCQGASHTRHLPERRYLRDEHELHGQRRQRGDHPLLQQRQQGGVPHGGGADRPRREVRIRPLRGDLLRGLHLPPRHPHLGQQRLPQLRQRLRRRADARGQRQDRQLLRGHRALGLVVPKNYRASSLAEV